MFCCLLASFFFKYCLFVSELRCFFMPFMRFALCRLWRCRLVLIETSRAGAGDEMLFFCFHSVGCCFSWEALSVVGSSFALFNTFSWLVVCFIYCMCYWLCLFHCSCMFACLFILSFHGLYVFLSDSSLSFSLFLFFFVSACLPAWQQEGRDPFLLNTHLHS